MFGLERQCYLWEVRSLPMVVLPVVTRNDTQSLLEKQLNQLHLKSMLLIFSSKAQLHLLSVSLCKMTTKLFLPLCNGGCSGVGTADALSAQLLEFCLVCKSI